MWSKVFMSDIVKLVQIYVCCLTDIISVILLIDPSSSIKLLSITANFTISSASGRSSWAAKNNGARHMMKIGATIYSFRGRTSLSSTSRRKWRKIDLRAILHYRTLKFPAWWIATEPLNWNIPAVIENFWGQTRADIAQYEISVKSSFFFFSILTICDHVYCRLIYIANPRSPQIQILYSTILLSK